MDKGAVLDASALLALMRNEPGAEAVASTLSRAVICAVNQAEVHASLVSAGLDPENAWWHITQIGCECVPFGARLAAIAGGLTKGAPRLRLSLGDRACLALTVDRQATVYTANPAWKDLSLGIEIEVIR